MSQSGSLARCFNHDLIPAGYEKIADPPVTTGLQVYQELFQSAVGLAGISQNFGGNGRYVRSDAGGGADRVVTGNLTGSGPLYGNAVLIHVIDAPRGQPTAIVELARGRPGDEGSGVTAVAVHARPQLDFAAAGIERQV